MSDNIIITHDGPVDVATGSGRNDATWRNKPWQWSALVKKFSGTVYTAETQAEYLTFKRDRQDEIKDIGGFVGGYCTNGRRKSNTIAHRQLITLDIDHAPKTFWDDFQMMFGCAAAMYSTHKHSPASPRLRLIIPLDREVLSDEYEPIARRIAGNMSIDDFDDTTYDVNRLMFWPSTSKGAEFEFQYQDGEWLNADSILNSYRNWRDSSEWPTSSRQNVRILQGIKKQGDPLEKGGIVGAFCRTYTISEAITTFLSDSYEPCDIEGRYTYKEGSTSAGLIVYDDKYAYSHHGTDPISHKLCNAFDLVRLHKYGPRDSDVKEGTPGNKLPSYTLMTEFAAKDKEVRKRIGSERLAEAKADFEGVDFTDNEIEGGIPVKVSNDWLAELDADKKGNLQSTINNIVLILENDPALKGCIAYDDFEKRAVMLRRLPWRNKEEQGTRYLTDIDDDNLTYYIEKIYGLSATKLDTALSVIYERTRFHPVREYLRSVVWDGSKRVDTMFIDYLGADDNEYVRTVSRKALVACIARIMQPGVKFDNVLTTVGEEGLNKSTLIDKLGGRWFSDSFLTVVGKEAFEQLQGVWLVEMAELSALKNAEVEAVKHFVGKREDRYRVAFGKRLENFPRQCVFFGSVNKFSFLKGINGDRRFWPVPCEKDRRTKSVFTDLTEAEIAQIWAEALHIYDQGEQLHLSKEMEAQAKQMQVDHSEQDDRAGLIEAYLNTKLPENWDGLDTYQRRDFLKNHDNADDIQPAGVAVRQRVCVAEIWVEALGGMQKEMSVHNTRFIHDIMRTLDGWEMYKSKTDFRGYGTQRGYFRMAVKGSKNTADTAVGLKNLRGREN